ncbi:MAG: PQQ-binding-like beta-propeller repeat protein [Saccharospirillaceae bacterium]|nr:PQQ-binding-like beta-propeller repeat protein [Pseudomonadales bacterium]NRB79312.1 PQQ-binding-like beta-propeller repeat protein [Saccharospirillaceae bacterium]
MRVKTLTGLISLFAVLMLITSCSSKKVKRKPAPLAPQVIMGAKFKINWSVNLDSDSSFQLLQPHIMAEKILTVSTEGKLYAINHDGDILSQKWLEPVSSGVSKTSLGVSYVNQNGFIQHRDENLNVLWSSDLKALSFHAPIEIDGLLVVQTIDGRLSSFDLEKGQLQWVYQIIQPELTIKGHSAPLIYKNNIITAFANGRIVSIAAKTGDVNWEYSLKGAVSSNVLENLLDIDAPMQIIRNQLFVMGNHGNMTVLNLDQGNPLWEKDIQSLKSFALDEINNRLYVVLVDGSLTAINMATGTFVWHEKFLLYRNPTGIVLVNGVLLVGDYEGYLHAVSTKNGQPLNRYRIDRSSIQTKIIEYNSNVYIQSQSGKLISLSVSEI